MGDRLRVLCGDFYVQRGRTHPLAIKTQYELSGRRVKVSAKVSVIVRFKWLNVSAVLVIQIHFNILNIHEIEGGEPVATRYKVVQE